MRRSPKILTAVVALFACLGAPAFLCAQADFHVVRTYPNPSTPSFAQTGSVTEPATTASVPRVIRVSGSWQPADSQPARQVEVVTVAIYADETGGMPLWSETDNVTIGPGGAYDVLLGSTARDGVPLEVFASKGPRWLGVLFERVGEHELPRILLSSVRTRCALLTPTPSVGCPRPPSC